MKKKILFVLTGLPMGGIETYILRLANQLHETGHTVEVILISDKYDCQLFSELSKTAKIYIHEKTRRLSASSWINAFLPLGSRSSFVTYDIVHVVDLLTLGFIYLNRKSLDFKALSIGIYHSMEVSWWRGRNVYFRGRLLEIYDKNISLTLFPNESTAVLAADLAGCSGIHSDILPLGVNLKKYIDCKACFNSKRIVSVGRLVEFKAYNRHMIAQLSAVRNYGEYEYYIYGEGPERESLMRLAELCGVSSYVHFMGQVNYSDLPSILNDCFCFVGSGTAIIEASSAGIPSIVGIESIEHPLTCGFFADILGYSYNEESATTRRISYYDALSQIIKLSELDFLRLSDRHRKKAGEFDIVKTTEDFIEKSNKILDVSLPFSRLRALLSLIISILRFGPASLKRRFERVSD